MASGVGEFAAITIAVLLAHRRTRGDQTVEANVFRGLIWVMVVAYPLLAVAYVGDVWGALIEPVFFVSFTAVLVAELFEPVGSSVPSTDRARSTPTTERSGA